MSRNSKSDGETVSFGVRLSKADREWLEATARANGVEVSQLVRMAIEALRQYVAAHDGKLHLPININEFWALKPQPAQEQHSYPRAAEDPTPYTTPKRASKGA